MVWFFKKKEKRPAQSDYRAPRLRVVALRGLRAEITAGLVAHAQLSNISASGVGFIVADGFPWPAPGGTVQGKFLFGNAEVPFMGEVVHSTGQVVGLRFSGETGPIATMVQEYFDVELRARAMVEVKREMLQEEPDGKPRWFRSARGFELFLVESEPGKIVYFYLRFLGHYFEAGRGRALRYGNVVDVQRSAQAQYKASEVIQYQTEISTDTRLAAIRAIENVSGLGEALMGYLRDQLSPR